MDLTYGVSEYDRSRGNLPALPVVNMFAEQAPMSDKPILQSRPGLQNSGISMGVGPVKALYQVDGVLSNALFGISDNKLYSSSTNLGTINGTGHAKLAAFEALIFANQGQSVYQWDGASLTTVATPGGFDVLDICVGAERLIVIDKGTGKFYWSDTLTDTIGALSFATAENSPDNLKACLYIGDVLYLFGSETVELWPVATDPAAPFQPLIGRVFPIGIRDTGCAIPLSNTFAWVTSKNQVFVGASLTASNFGTPNSRVSQPYLEAKLAASTTCNLWSFEIESTEFLAVRLDNSTHIMNLLTKTWSEFQSYGKSNFIPQCYVKGTFGSSIDGHLMTWTEDHADFGSVLERRFRAGTPVVSGTTALMNVFVDTNSGQTPFIISTYADPTIELRLSRDGGFEWSDWKSKSLGKQGHYRENVQWRSLGMFGFPGILCEFRVTDPVPFRVSGVSANDPYGDI